MSLLNANWLRVVATLFLIAPLCHFYVETPSLVALRTETATDTVRASVNKQDDFKMAFDESLGFFDDVTSTDWELMRNITLGRVNYQNEKNPLIHRQNPSWWYQVNWDPDFSCRHDTKIGVGDGGKWVCDPHRLVKQSRRRMDQYQKENKTEGVHAGCIVYSVGSNGDFRFEEGIADLLPGACEIHTFDFTDYSAKVPSGRNIFFHAWGLKPSYNETKQTFDGGFGRPANLNRGNFKTFAETKKELGHEGRPIDIFKIDCEGCEWTTYKDWIGADMRQILVEVHRVPPVAEDFFGDLQRAGYVMFHKEPNIQFGGGACVEFTFLKLDKSFVENRLEAQRNPAGQLRRLTGYPKPMQFGMLRRALQTLGWQ